MERRPGKLVEVEDFKRTGNRFLLGRGILGSVNSGIDDRRSAETNRRPDSVVGRIVADEANINTYLGQGRILYTCTWTNLSGEKRSEGEWCEQVGGSGRHTIMDGANETSVTGRAIPWYIGHGNGGEVRSRPKVMGGQDISHFCLGGE